MTDSGPPRPPANERLAMAAMALCCVVPMLTIVILTSTFSVAFGPAVGIAIGLTVAIGLAGWAIVRRRTTH